MLVEVFYRRYGHDYTLRSARTCAEAESIAQRICDEGDLVAMFVTDSRLPDVDHIFEAIHRWRLVVPSSRRVIAAYKDYFMDDGPGLRIGMAKGKYDAYLLMPQGKRDEDFHIAITELLTEWTSTVPQPEVVSAKVITPQHDALAMAIRDFLDRMGMQNGIYHPDDPQLAEFMVRIKEELGVDEPTLPGRRGPRSGAPSRPRSVREVARSIYPRTQAQDRRRRRPRRGGRRAGRPGRRRLRSLRGTLGRRAGGRGHRRPGWHQLDDPQLPRLPARDLRDAAGQSGPQPGTAVRHRFPARLGGHRARGGPGRRAAPAPHRGRRRPGPHRARLRRGRLPQARGALARGAGRRRGQLRRGDDGGPRDGGVRRRGRRRRQLRRPGGAASGPVRELGDDRGPAAGPRGDHVEVPHRRDQLQRADRRAAEHPRDRRRRRGPARVALPRGHRTPASGPRRRRGGCSCCSAPSRAATGCRRSWPATRTASC